ncbi:hypothetical protein AVEN_132855-1, partial [Araneus ventricosus]
MAIGCLQTGRDDMDSSLCLCFSDPCSCNTEKYG